MSDLQKIELAVGILLVLLGVLGAFKKPWTRALALGAGALLLLMALFKLPQ
jgi:hypothetical protein